MTEFNLWGFDGYQGLWWGDEFKPHGYELVADADQPAGWTSSLSQWPWGDPPPGYITDEIVNFHTTGAGLDFNNPTSEEFEFRVLLDQDALSWQDPVRYPDVTKMLPDGRVQLGMWFGGWWTDEQGIYEGSMIVTGAPVPEPGTMLLFGAGLVALAGFRLRRKFRKG